MGKKIKFTVEVKKRNPYGLIALMRGTAGKFPNKWKERDRRACRGPVRHDDNA